MLKLLEFLGVFKLFKFLTAGSTQEHAEARDDIEAPAGSSGIALTNLATDQTPITGAPPRGAEGQSEMPSQSKGFARANNSSDAVLPRPPARPKITVGEHQMGKFPTRDQVHLPAFVVHVYTFSFSVVPDLNIIIPCPSTDYPPPP